jgi:eukaryotic-like serine/threonine-protein kinase
MLSLVRRWRGSASSAGVDATPATTAAAEHHAGPYELRLELGAGGMATVYLARRDSEHGLGRMVAVKLIHPHLANDREFIDMFMDEAELASQIRHPNVCAVLDYSLRQDEPYLVMEYLVGESLMSVARALERSTDFDPVRLAACVARMLADACEGLHAAHELTDADGQPLHVVHRDVSLENVFVTYDGVAKVMDFGVATAANKRHHTRTGMVKGKFASVAPECLKGHRPDRRADIWGVGVIAWELLTGQRLFRRDTDVDTLFAVSEAPILPPSECRPGLPPALDAIVMRALARDPAERYATARELGRDLARFSARGGEVVTPADVAEWLSELFPGGRERRQQILALAAQVGAQEGDQDQPPDGDADVTGRSTSSPAPARLEPTMLATGLWLGRRRASVPPPLPRSPLPPRARVPAPPSRWRSSLRTAAVVIASASAGALAALVAQAFFDGPFLLRSADALPGFAPGPSSRSATVVLDGTDKAREIVLRIRVDPAASSPPEMVIEAQEAAAALEPSLQDPAGDVPAALGVSAR